MNVHKRDVEVNLLKKRWSQNSYKEEKSNFNGTHDGGVISINAGKEYSKYNELKREKGSVIFETRIS